MEVTLWGKQRKLKKKQGKRLNPCYCGSYPLGNFQSHIDEIKQTGLNPCYCGSYPLGEARLGIEEDDKKLS